jgi:hypothetical protein
MEDTLKRDSVIVVSGAVLLWFLFRNKNSSTVSAVDNSPISIPTFNPADYFTGGSNTNQSSANSLADKYIPLFGFVGGSGSNSANQIPAVTYTPNTYSVPAYVAPPVVPFVAPTLSKLVLPQPVAPQPMQPMVQPAPPIITLTPKPVAAPMVKPVDQNAGKIYIGQNNYGMIPGYYTQNQIDQYQANQSNFNMGGGGA